MSKHWLILAMVIALIVAACGTSTTSPAAIVVETSPSTAAASSGATAAAGPTASPTATADPTPTPAPTPTPTPAPWATHKSKRFHYTIKYPPDWVVTPGSAKLADQIDDYSSHFVYVSRDTVSGSISLNLTVTHDIASYKSHFKAKLLSNKKITVARWPGRLLTFFGTSGGRKVYIQEIILAKGKVAYFISMFGDRSSARPDTPLFKSIYKTFKPKA